MNIDQRRVRYNKQLRLHFYNYDRPTRFKLQNAHHTIKLDPMPSNSFGLKLERADEGLDEGGGASGGGGGDEDSGSTVHSMIKFLGEDYVDGLTAGPEAGEARGARAPDQPAGRSEAAQQQQQQTQQRQQTQRSHGRREPRRNVAAAGQNDNQAAAAALAEAELEVSATSNANTNADGARSGRLSVGAQHKQQAAASGSGYQSLDGNSLDEASRFAAATAAANDPFAYNGAPTIKLDWLEQGYNEFRLVDIHFHWGERRDNGSEHAIDGNRSAMEVSYRPLFGRRRQRRRRQ